MSRLTRESIRTSQVDLPAIGKVKNELRCQAHYILYGQHHCLSQRGFQHWANQLAYSALIEAGTEAINERADLIGLYDSPTKAYAGPLPHQCSFIVANVKGP